jgi:putative membrane protein
MSLGQATREVLACEWKLLRVHRKLALAFLGVLFVPAVYAWIYLFAMWDPASHTRDLPAGLVNLDTGAKYRDRSLNLGSEVITSIERQGQFAYRVYEDAQQARIAGRAARCRQADDLHQRGQQLRQCRLRAPLRA